MVFVRAKMIARTPALLRTLVCASLEEGDVSGDVLIGPEQRPKAGSAGAALGMSVSSEVSGRVVRICGELDKETRNQLVVMCVAGNQPAVIVDLTALTFMDCAGYGAIVTIRHVLEHSARSLTIRNQTGQPARLLDMIAALELSNASPSSSVASTAGSSARP
jgi:anti-anti-sigma factor